MIIGAPISGSTNEIIQILADKVPAPIAQLLLKSLLSLLPKRDGIPQARSTFRCDFQHAASPPAFVPDLDQPFGLERAQIARERAPIHPHELGKGGDRQCV